MRLQSHQSLCGPASVANALRARGRGATEDKIAAAVKLRLSASDPHPEQDGTSVQSLEKALESQGFTGRPWSVADEDSAWHALRGRLLDGDPVLLAVDYEGDAATHWVVGVGVLGDRVLVADSADPEIVLSYDRRQLARRWKADLPEPRFHGLTIQRRKK